MKFDGTIHGFEFIKETELPEIQGVLREAVYKKNGAKLLFIDREDSNKTFAITFKTIPEDDTGVFHIIEHSVLCGSDKYPVKEPFVELLKGSLKTFLNAFTFPDKTMYPVSSRNDKDFLNLVDVYMDAVLHPVAIKKPEIFYQEGWHYELADKDGDMTYKGVVFNEMKGAYSSADEVQMSAMASLLYKDTCYGKDSGGNPRYITDLTYEEFVASHAKYYHPSNARIILDGSVDLNKTLALLDSFLSEYDYLDINSDIPALCHRGHSEKTISYEIAEGEDASNKYRVCLGFATAPFNERRSITALSIITDAIAGSNDSVFKKAMLESGICEDADFIAYDGIRDNSLFIEIKNVKSEHMLRAKELCFDVIRGIVKDGIDKKALTASFNALEFRIREQDMATTPRGIAYAISALETWLYDGEAKDGLAFEKDIAYLREMIDTDYYEKILEKYILNSDHSATLYMIPSSTLGEERGADEMARLASIKASMSEEELKRIEELTKSIELWQKTPDSEQALRTIPSVCISDIKELPERFLTERIDVQGVPAIYTKSDSRGIIYTTLLFDVSDFDENELFLIPILSSLYKNVRTDVSTPSEIQNKVKTELGRFSVSTIVAKRGGIVSPYVQVKVGLLASKTKSAEELIGEILLTSRFDDKEAIKTIVKQIKNSSQESIAASGHSAAFTRASAYTDSLVSVVEHMDGIESYLKLKALDKDYLLYADKLLVKLSEMAARIFTRKRLTVAYSGEFSEGYAMRLSEIFPEGESFERGSKIKPLGVRREGILIPAAISFASMAGSVSNNDEEAHGSLSVVRSILSYGFLWNSIRVQGGAYGAGFIKRAGGLVGFYTYRDPNPSRSTDVFKESADFLREFVKSAESFENFVIGALGDSEPLITPRVIDALALLDYVSGKTYEDALKARNELINTSGDDILKIAESLEKMISGSGVCIIGGKAQLDSAKDKIDTVIEI